ncbi:hypothetical protein GGI12_004343 [Dipsacomyces acuminosporus]|nr:hypothetical protein GGI12_004343 [Dipsacomyces acuminosporus]
MKYTTIAALLAAPFLVANAFSVSTLNGPVTQNDISSFKAGTKNLQPPSAWDSVEWAQGKAGESIKSFGLVYEISKDADVLNKMLAFTDKLLSLRNDKSSKRCSIWTGANDPAWVNCADDKLGGKVYTAGGQGDYVGHLGYAARLILESPSIWNKDVPDKDPHRFGRTYLQRAKTYVREADYSVDKHILSSLLDLSRQGRQYFAAKSPYKGGQPVPWNQQAMFNYGFSNLALAHELLRDDPARAGRYNGLVQSSISWFFSVAKSYKDKKGNTAYVWAYSVDQPRDVEDNNHAHIYLAGISRLYALGKYGLTLDKLQPFSYTIIDNVIRGRRDYAGKIDGTDGSGNASPTDYLRSGNLLSAEWLPSAFNKYVTDINPKSISRIEVFARLLWLKNRLNKTKFAPSTN